MVTQNGAKIQTAQDLIDREFGLKTEVRLSRLVTQIETTVTQILLPNPGRIAFTITVLGANFAYVLNDPGVSASWGAYQREWRPGRVYLFRGFYARHTRPLGHR